jgi:cell filamentation protein
MSEPLDELESRLTTIRIYELWFRPLPDRFDAAALRETHRYIFQDFPDFGLTDPPPGQFREYLLDADWSKKRMLPSIGELSFVCYSPMAKSDLADLDKALKAAQPDTLRKLKPKEFAIAISTLYAHLDYVHPFHEGNSRCLRAFTEQIARASGYHLDWERFNRSERSRDFLCIARDRAVHARTRWRAHGNTFSQNSIPGKHRIFTDLVKQITAPAPQFSLPAWTPARPDSTQDSPAPAPAR